MYTQNEIVTVHRICYSQTLLIIDIFGPDLTKFKDGIE